MGTRITIPGVPEHVRNRLAERAALQGKSMQDFLRGELLRIASRPPLAVWLEAVRNRKREAGTRVDAATILQARDADRK